MKNPDSDKILTTQRYIEKEGGGGGRRHTLYSLPDSNDQSEEKLGVGLVHWEEYGVPGFIHIFFPVLLDSMD